MESDLVILEWNWLPTSGLDWRESTSPCENRTGVSLSSRSVLGSVGTGLGGNSRCPNLRCRRRRRFGGPGSHLESLLQLQWQFFRHVLAESLAFLDYVISRDSEAMPRRASP
jgi:hypothetical protein